MDIIAEKLGDADLARRIAKQIRDCYHNEYDNYLCCKCGLDRHHCGGYGSWECGICHTDTYHKSDGFEICFSRFEECMTCGYMTKRCDNEIGVVDLNSIDVSYWEHNLEKLSKVDAYKFRLSNMSTEAKELLDKYNITYEYVPKY